MTQETPDHAQRVQNLMKKWDCLIEELQTAVRHAGPKHRKPYDDAVEQLITLREGTRRGLLQVEDFDDLGCPHVASPDHEDALEDVLEGDWDVMKSPKTKYGPE